MNARVGVFFTLSCLVAGGCDSESPLGAGGQGGATSAGSSSGGSSSSSSQPGALRFEFEPIELEGSHVDVTEVRFLPPGGAKSGAAEFFLLEKAGRVTHYVLEGDRATSLGAFWIPNVSDETDCGLISLAFDPSFARTGHFYVGYCVDRHASGIARMTIHRDDFAATPASAQPILFLEEPAAAHAWHNVGAIGFEPGGVMWALFGEKTIPSNAQDPTNDLGKLLRIVPDPSGQGHTPAPDNPFVGQVGKSPDIYAMGLRSPWRGALDAQGRYWIADVGADDYEEVNVVRHAGANLGWPLAEGQCMDACTGLSDPITGWTRSSNELYVKEDPEVSPTGRRSAWVAGPYGRSGVDRYAGRLNDVMLVGDFFGGWIRGIRLGEDGAIASDEPLGHLQAAASWDEGPDGFLYVATFGSYKNAEAVEPSGRLWRVVPRP